MKGWRMMVIIVFCFVGLSGCASTDFLNSVLPSASIEKPLLNTQDHLNHAQMLEQDVGRLEEQISRINQKIARYEQKPYLDPKRFRRDGLKILRGSNLKQIETLREKVAWHRAQASRLAGLDASEQDQTMEGRNIMNEQAPLSTSQAPRRAPVSHTLNDMTTSS